ncbi:MAG TPA: cell wall-binding repeat-containing protein [Candidatus Limnocylindria bacterium]
MSQRSLTRIVAVLFAVATLTTGLAAPALAVDGQAFVNGANAKRAQNGLGPVSLHAAIDQITVERANQMASNDKLEHDLAYVQRRLNELGVCWSGYGEIIYWERGYPSFDPQRAVQAWYDSPGHKAIMLGDYNAAGGSWAKNAASRGIYAVMVFVKVCGPVAPPPPSDPAESVRVAGSDRYGTAAAVSSVSFAPGVGVAYVATGANFPDALAVGSAASQAGGPVLLVKRDEIPSATAAELARLKPGRIVVVGGAGVVSDQVAAWLAGYATSHQVSRIAGADRYATAALVSQAHFAAGTAVAYVATGANFPDALAGSAAAGLENGPTLLVKPAAVPAATAAELQRLHPARIVILGSSAIVSDGVAQALAGLTGAAVSRIYGADRYGTAVNLSRSNYAANGPSTVFVATGSAFPDGLAASPVAGSLPGPLLLVPTYSLPSAVASELQRLAPDRVVVLGGSGAVSDGVVNAINAVVP